LAATRTGYRWNVTNNRAETFADALQLLESDQDVDKFVNDQFATGVELLRPETDQLVSGHSGASEFWRQYLAQFTEIHSSFDRITDTGDLGVLEWTSTGQLATGGSIEYRGVSVLDFDDTDHVRRFSTYYDTKPFGLTH